MKNTPVKKLYLGDSIYRDEVYAEYDGLQIRLYTSNGFSDTNEIFLDSGATQTLMAFINKCLGDEIDKNGQVKE